MLPVHKSWHWRCLNTNMYFRTCQNIIKCREYNWYYCQATKYIFKYITKGADRAMASTEVEGQPRNEIQDFIDLRSVGSSEAAWQLFSFPVASMQPSVLALRVHLKDQQQIGKLPKKVIFFIELVLLILTWHFLIHYW